MTGPLTLNLFDRRFAELVELGRSRIPNLAPAWTDHNYHDPGIMLIDVLAWTAEAQIYALSRMRADERLAYAALLGITPHGPLPAAGLVWPAPRSPAPAGLLTMDAAVRSGKPDAPTFWPTASVLLVPARLVALETHLARGDRVDQASANRPDGAGFDPFGPRGDPGDRLELAFACCPGQHLFSGLAGQADPVTKDLRVSLGVRVRASPPAAAEAEAMPATRWDVTLVSTATAERWPVPVNADHSHGFAHSGTLLLDVGAVPRSPPVERFTLELRSRGGFARPPRIECIELNVLPVRQSGSVVQELHVGNGLPDQVLRLDQPGLRFDAAGPAVTVEVEGDPEPWTERPDFESSGPADTHFLVDTASGMVAFGNGVNGKVPPCYAQILLGYATSAGAAGNLPRSQHWTVHGVAGEFGLNLDPMAGGADRSGLADLRREARRQVKEAHALISSDDLIAAALGEPHLQVARAEIIGARGGCASSETLTLVALRTRTPGVTEPAPESARWLQALQRALAPGLPLGQRLHVIAPRYETFAVRARLVAAPQEDPRQIAAGAMALLEGRLAVTAEWPGAAAYPLGQPLSTQQVAAWLRQLPGVARVLDCQLYVGATPVPGQLDLPLAGLPRLDTAACAISVERAAGRPT
jgi:predicted phage baseplate assembly protein